MPIKVLELVNGKVAISIGKKIIILDSKLNLVKTRDLLVSGNILDMWQSISGKVYVGTTQGMYSFVNLEEELRPDSIKIQTKQMLSVNDCKGRQLWIGTNDGLFKEEYNNYSVAAKIQHTAKLSAFGLIREGKLLLGTNDGEIFDISFSNLEKTKKHRLTKKRVKSVYVFSPSEQWIRTEGGTFLLDEKGTVKEQLFLPRDISFINKDSVCLCVHTDWKIERKADIWMPGYLLKDEYKYRLGSHESSCIKIHYSQDSILWVYNEAGVKKHQNNISTLDTLVTKLLGFAKVSKIESRDKAVFFATNGIGLIVRRGNDVIQLTKQSGLLDNKIRDIYPDPQRGLWVAYQKGVQKLDWSENEGLEVLNLPQGIIPSKGKDIVQIVADSTYLYVLTEDDVYQVKKPGTRIEEQKLKPFITGITLNENTKLGDSIPELSYQENNLRFDFLAISFRAMGNIQYRYRLNGLEKSWALTTSRFAKYPSLQPGTYDFEVQAKVIGEDWGESVFASRFEIRPPFWQTWWFKLSSVLFLLLLSGLIFYLILRANRRRNHLIQQTMLAKHKALITQMNPHFIFNSLNSIQRFFITNDLESANDYLVDFGNLIRIILENGREGSITLEKEERLLDLYLKLESLRLKQKFSFKINCQGINLEKVMIPPMLLQPFVENAIWHGVAGLEDRPGRIEVRMNVRDDLLCVEIEDNGLGRGAKSTINVGRSTAHQSLATRITKDRIELIKAEHPDRVLFEILDLKDANAEPSGTLVRIHLPLEIQELTNIEKHESSTY